jgi:uncharacterized protein (DUF4415 family)
MIAAWFAPIEPTEPANNAGTQLGRLGLSLMSQWYCWLFTFAGRITMAKKSSASSRPAKLKRMTSEDIGNKQWTKEERETLRRHAAKQASGDDSDIVFDDIPRLTDEQLAQMVRLRGVRPKVPVSVRLEPRVLAWLKSKGEGHLTRINDILRNIMEAEQRIAHR